MQRPLEIWPRYFFLNSKHEEILSKVGIIFEKNIEDFKKLKKNLFFSPQRAENGFLDNRRSLLIETKLPFHCFMGMQLKF